MRSLKDIRKQSRYMQARQGSAAWAGLFMSAASAPGSRPGGRQCQPTLMQGLRPRAQLFWRRVAIVGDDIVRDRQPACPRSLCRHDTPYGRLRQPAARLHAGDLRGGIAIDHADAVHARASAAATRPATAPRTPGSSRRASAWRSVSSPINGCSTASSRCRTATSAKARSRIQAQSSEPSSASARRRTPARSRAWPNRRQRSAPARSHRCPPRTRPIRPACPPRATCPSRCPRQTYFEYAHRFVPCMAARAPAPCSMVMATAPARARRPATTPPPRPTPGRGRKARLATAGSAGQRHRTAHQHAGQRRRQQQHGQRAHPNHAPSAASSKSP